MFFMIKRVSQTMNMSPKEKKAVVVTLNNYINILKDSKNTQNILDLKQNHIIEDSPLLNDIKKFISNNNTGTVVMKANTITL